MPTPTQRALHFLRNSFAYCEVVERWNPFSKTRKDLFKCVDIVCIGQSQIIGVQCTSGVNHGARREKILRTPAMKAWVASGAGLWVLSFSKKGPRGKQKRWEENCEFITLEMFK